MKKTFRLLCITLLAGNALQLPAQQVYSLDRCVEMALESNKDIQAAEKAMQKAEKATEKAAESAAEALGGGGAN